MLSRGPSTDHVSPFRFGADPERILCVVTFAKATVWRGGTADTGPQTSELSPREPSPFFHPSSALRGRSGATDSFQAMDDQLDQ